MSFMQPVIIQEDYYEVETNQGTWIVPISVSGRVKRLKDLDMYVEGKATHRQLIKGCYVCRMSAPGYMDCTEWAAFPTEKECREYLEEMYGEDE